MLGRAGAGGDFPFTPENVLTLNGRAIGIDTAVDDAAGYDRSIINEDEATKIWDAIMIVQHYGRPRVNDDATDFISCELLSVAARALKGGGIYDLLDRCDLALHFLSCQSRAVKVRQLGGLTRDPEKVGVKAIGLDRGILLMRTHVTTLDENLFA